MFTRIVMLMFIVTLALPVTPLTRPGETAQRSWSDIAVAANGKQHKHHKKAKPRTVRQTVTQTFASSGPISIPSGASTNEKGPANPYPSAIAVSGFTNGTITDVNLILDDFSHTYPRDVDILLTRNDGRQALVLSDVIDGDDAVDVDLILDDEAVAPLSGNSEPLTAGTFRPTNIEGYPDTFDAPAPAPNGIVALSTFNGADPNGTWQLWVMDNGDPSVISDAGDLGSWEVQITAEVDIQVPHQAKTKDKKGKHRHGAK